jgi:Uma2 family endonuclease
MEALKQDRNNYIFDEYLILEQFSEIRHEYYFGEVFAMAGTTKRHNLIVNNFNGALRMALKGKKCLTFTEQIKVQIIEKHHYVYPDIVVSCNPNENDALSICFPVLIIEVLSEATEDYDRHEKFEAYKTITSLKYYVLVEQKRNIIELFTRENEKWIQTLIYNLQSNFEIPELCINIPLTEIYENIEFDKKPEFHRNRTY